MRCTPTDLPGVLVIEPLVHGDERGFFLESYHAGRYASEAGITLPFVQDNHSRSRQHTLRGLHFQRNQPQGKLIRVIEGEILDVAADVDPASVHYGRWVAVTLSAENFRQLYVPPGYAHGFCVVSEVAQVEYKCTAPYDPTDEDGVMWNDPVLGIDWPTATPILSARDQQHRPLRAR
ncbi:MAG TPA: dTDP-4-dehydrorhamnose 3,5-epimerase [Luteitalea sp.]|nr:dTDP-4-dehydrorhamnose 3,5-epimerase [Luteitalea sp.]